MMCHVWIVSRKPSETGKYPAPTSPVRSPDKLWLRQLIPSAVKDPLSMITLVKLTSECVGVASPSSGETGQAGTAPTGEVVSSEAIQLSWDIAQRLDRELKIDASIRYVITLSQGSASDE